MTDELSKPQMAALAALAAAIVAVVAVAAVFVFSQPDPVDSVTFCPRNGAETGRTVLLIDISDRLNAGQQARLESELASIGKRSGRRASPYLKKGDRLTVYFLEEEDFPPTKVFDFCNPGDAADRSLTESLSEGKLFVEARWDKFSTDILKSVNDRMAASSGSDTSPILEGLKYVREKEFPPPDLIRDDLSHRILLWSDMIQNSRSESHFGGVGDVRSVYKVLPLNLDKVETIVFHIASEKYSRFQTNEQVAWWRRIFALAGTDLDWRVF